jgi:cellulose biosynthesis protein BcsQ
VPTGDSLDIILKLLGYAAPVVGGLAIWSVTKYIRLLHVEKEAEQVRRDKDAAAAQLAEARQQHESTRLALTDRLDRIRASYQEARDKFYRIRKAYLGLRDQKPEPPGPPAEPGMVENLKVRLTRTEAERDDARQQAERLEQQIEDITRFDGRLWLRPPTGPFPSFRPRGERKAVIISVLNLKGGVGKTTLTANLTATLARADAPGLMIDLDYQRSLSMLLVDNKDRILLHRGGLTAQRFLAGEAHAAAELVGKLKDLDPAVPHCSVLTNSDARAGGQPADSLEETETRLMVEWLLDRRRPDPRFFLREALHDRDLGFGYVLLDCPPRLTTACVNALAASDFVLIPVVPDPVSTRAVENLLRTLKRFRDELCPDLAVLGVVPNMVRLLKGEPIRDHADALTELKAAVAEVWDEPFPVFEACIKHDSAFGKSAAAIDADGTVRLAVSDPEIGAAFQALAHELEKEVRRHASRRTATVPAKPGARARSGR